MYNNTVTAYSPNINFLGITVAENLKDMSILIYCVELEFLIMHILCVMLRMVLYFG